MEKEIKIQTNDGHLIYGTLNYMQDSCSKLIVFVHGLSDNKEHRLVFNTSKFFKTKGFHTLRISLYSDEKKARILEECSIGTFVEDINSVIDEFSGKYEKIFICCHSLGFVVLDCDLKNVTSLILWDPSLALRKERIENIKYYPELKSYMINWGVSFIVGKQLKIDWENINETRLLKNLTKPCAIFMAEKNNFKLGWKKNLEYLKSRNIYKEIKGASHDFTEEGKEDELFGESLKWINSFKDASRT